MLKDFRQALNKLAAKKSDFIVVDSQGTLSEHQDWGLEIAEWDDEIHPNKSGFTKLMKQAIGPVVREQLART